LLPTLLQPGVRCGYFHAEGGPRGDYAWALFGKADVVQAGATATLRAKALMLTGAADLLRPRPVGVFTPAMDQGQADVFVTYCTTPAARKEVPRPKIVAIPDTLQVGAAYGR
jgi:hypothetical protein